MKNDFYTSKYIFCDSNVIYTKLISWFMDINNPPVRTKERTLLMDHLFVLILSKDPHLLQESQTE